MEIPKRLARSSGPTDTTHETSENPPDAGFKYRGLTHALNTNPLTGLNTSPATGTTVITESRLSNQFPRIIPLDGVSMLYGRISHDRPVGGRVGVSDNAAPPIGNHLDFTSKPTAWTSLGGSDNTGFTFSSGAGPASWAKRSPGQDGLVESGAGSARGPSRTSGPTSLTRRRSTSKRAVFSLAPADENDEDSVADDSFADDGSPNLWQPFGGFAKTTITKPTPKTSGLNKLMQVHAEATTNNHGESERNSYQRRGGESPPNPLQPAHHASLYLMFDQLNAHGFEDEYIPGLDYQACVEQWLEEGKGLGGASAFAVGGSYEGSEGSFSAISREVSRINLEDLHSQVSPIMMKRPGVTAEVRSTSVAGAARAAARSGTLGTPRAAKPHEIDFEAIYAKLPENFGSLPFSVRRKTFMELEPTVDYSQFSLHLKKSGKRRSLRALTLGDISVGSGMTPQNSGFVIRPGSELVPGEFASTPGSSGSPGSVILGHRLGRVLGSGAWGLVRECAAPSGAIRAIKIVKTKNTTVKHRFCKEMDLWSKMNHPNLLPLLNHMETEEAMFCITLKVGGGTLFEMVQSWGVYSDPILLVGRAERLNMVRSVMKMVGGALKYLHEELGVVHGDLKLENCLVEQGERDAFKVVLCDFGMAQVYTKRTGSRRPSITRSLSSSTLTRHKSLVRLGKAVAVDTGEAVLGRPTSSPVAEKVMGSTGFTELGPSLVMGSTEMVPNRALGSLVHISSYTGSSSSPFGKASESPLWQAQASLASQVNFPQLLLQSMFDIHKANAEAKVPALLDPDLPHSHIGSLPYASPEILLPSPPPLGPLADCWAFGVMGYTMAVGRLPFCDSYEPRLRAEISAGRYDRTALKEASAPKETLGLEKVGLDDLAEQQRVVRVGKSVERTVLGCLEVDVVRRWDIAAIERELVLGSL